MTEREIAAVLRSALHQRHGAFHQVLGEYVGINLSDDDLDAMAHAVAERFASLPILGMCIYCGKRDRYNTADAMVDAMQAHTAECSQHPIHEIADRDARLARVVGALANLLDAAVAYDLIASSDPDALERTLLSDFYRAKAQAYGALVDVGAREEQSR